MIQTSNDILSLSGWLSVWNTDIREKEETDRVIDRDRATDRQKDSQEDRQKTDR